MTAVEEDMDLMQTGIVQARWSDQKPSRFQPASELDEALQPWAPRADA